jgi:N-methylhydantoinase B/oxoprolinase/acetone carboxylase alpha subunit
MQTPGGGGYGKVESKPEASGKTDFGQQFIERGSVYEYRMAQESV